MTLTDRLIRITGADLDWPFDGSPCWLTRPRLGYVRRHPVDPFPCYPHLAVESLVAAVEERAPVPVLPQWYLVHFEELGRTNGWAFRGEHYNRPDRKDGDPADLEPIIALLGKRIPIHPAMTRYLVGHEYGHVVQYSLQQLAGAEEKDFLREYAQARGIEYSDRYGGRHWHTNTGEIFANDFRVLIAGLETDWWQHDVPPPQESAAAQAWWQKHALATWSNVPASA